MVHCARIRHRRPGTWDGHHKAGVAEVPHEHDDLRTRVHDMMTKKSSPAEVEKMLRSEVPLRRSARQGQPGWSDEELQ